MAITGTGTQADPWVVTTYAELVEKADDEGYIKIGNDINILEEYPDGDMPTLEIIKSDIDGDGRTISNWYKIDSGYCINETDSSDTVSCIHDLAIINVYITSSLTAFCKRSENSGRAFFENCDISGVFFKPFAYDGSVITFKGCSINGDFKSNAICDCSGYYENCYVKAKSTTTGTFLPDYPVDPIAKDSYLEFDVPNISGLDSYGHGFDNCVLDITSNAQFYVGGGNHAVSIVNTTHAPNAVPDGTNVKGVSDTNWLNASYLQGIGFNISV